MANEAATVILPFDTSQQVVVSPGGLTSDQVSGVQSQLAAGFVPQPTTGTPSNTTFLRGDGSWATPPSGGSGGSGGIGTDTDGTPYVS